MSSILVLGRWWQEDYELEIILGYMASLRPIWTTGDPALKNFLKRHVRDLTHNRISLSLGLLM